MTSSQTIPRRIYNAFLSGYLIVLSSQRSVQVWNHMIANKVMPDHQSWVALLEGCVKAQDLNGLKAMWQRMLKAGVEPDNYAWTTWVHGLFSMREVNQGLAALDDMGKRWTSAENAINAPQKNGRNLRGLQKLPGSAKAVNRCTKPSVEVVNGAVSALVQIRGNQIRQDKRIGFVQKILGWASNFDIKPDVRTYNSLIQLYMRAGETATAYKILNQMEKDGIKSDIATYTMLLTAAMDGPRFQSASPSEQTELILSMLSEIESAGLQPNAYIYSNAIDRLLKRSSNIDAVQALVSHMTSRNLIPSAHVYTSLVTHHFQQSPPNLPAVDAIAHQIRTAHLTASDRILFDRIIEGYASHGEIRRMNDVLGTMLRHGKMPDYNVLIAVLHAYVADGDMHAARKIVKDVQRGTGVAANRITGGVTGEARFFEAVKRLGLHVDEEEVEQSMGESMPELPGLRRKEKEGQHEELEYGGVTGDLGYEQRDPDATANEIRGQEQGQM